jgi:hemolysin III
MSRIKLADRQLPDYTRGEEIFNMVTHIVGAAFGVVVLVLCIVKSALMGNGFGIASGIVYGLSMIILYTMSAIYHGLSLKHATAKKVFQIMDHCTIFVLIAGTYTPVLLCSIRPVSLIWAWVLFGIVWGVSALGITLNAIDIKHFSKFSMACYLIMGWCIIFKFNLILKTISPVGIALLVLGGVAYTIGTIFYKAQDKKRYMHSIWHLWILLGSLLHFFCIFFYVL